MEFMQLSHRQGTVRKESLSIVSSNGYLQMEDVGYEDFSDICRIQINTVDWVLRFFRTLTL